MARKSGMWMLRSFRGSFRGEYTEHFECGFVQNALGKNAVVGPFFDMHRFGNISVSSQIFSRLPRIYGAYLGFMGPIVFQCCFSFIASTMPPVTENTVDYTVGLPSYIIVLLLTVIVIYYTYILPIYSIYKNI